jgi:hypothetical protein
MPAPTTATVGPILSEIGKVLLKHDMDTQGAVLAHALAVWLSGHTMKDGSDPTELRKAVLAGFIELAVRSVPLVDAAKRQRAKSRKDMMQ